MFGPGTNTGHGHVWSRPDGLKARCGGFGFCSTCNDDYARLVRFQEEYVLPSQKVPEPPELEHEIFSLTKNEILEILKYVIDNPSKYYELRVSSGSGIGPTTKISISGKTETERNITDYEAW